MTDALQDLAGVMAHCRQAARTAGGDACRLLHGRGRLWPGFEHMTIDWFPPMAVLTLFRPHPAEVMESVLAALHETLAPEGLEALVLQQRDGPRTCTEVVQGELPAQTLAHEAGLRYRIDLQRGQNLGFFLDMRQARTWLRDAAAGGRSVLNLFAFTCAFSVAARAGGAGRVVNIDLSRQSLDTGRENHRLNGLSTDNVYFLDHDIFRSWKKLHALGRYDIIVMDPPTAQKGSFSAEKDYAKVVRRFAKLLKPEADVLACLNAPALGEDFLDDVFARELPGATRVVRLANPAAFDDVDAQAALKVVHYRYRRPAGLPALESD